MKIQSKFQLGMGVARALVLLLALLSCCPVYAQLLISEIYYDAVGADNGQVFIELVGTPGMTLDGLSLLGINGSDGNIYKSIPLSGQIPEDRLFVIGDDDGSGSTAVLNVDLIADVDFQNGPDSILLWDGFAALDAVGYGNFGSAIFAGEGSPAIDVVAGYSLARWNLFGDSDNNAIDFVSLEVPTPGTSAMTLVPVPGTFLLFSSGLLLGGVGKVRKWRESRRLI